ncbi:MAG: NAD(P)H-hydrate dehydratase [Acidiferrobacterales bacterium]
MEELPEALYSAAQAREIDRLAALDRGPAAEPLMERAGAAAFELLRRRWPRARRVAVICGPGNNGGDGYVVAWRLQAAGITPLVMGPGGPGSQDSDAARARERLLASGVSVQPLCAADLARCDVVVDALFGTGLERPLQGEWLAAVGAINHCRAPVLAVDLPSGLHAGSGRVLGDAVRATTTLALIGLKAGMFTGSGRDCCGEICFDSLGVPAQSMAAVVPLARRISADSLRCLLRPRARYAHKGDAGRVLVVGGGPGMGGAVHLAGSAAYRSGAGLVTVAAHPAHAGSLNYGCPELIVHGVDGSGCLRPLLERADVVAVGPGLGQDEWARELWKVVRESHRPLVVDADALNLLAADPATSDDWILTPHPGEAGRLLRCSTGDVQNDRFAAVREIVRRFGGVCVLKGSGSLVAGGADDPVWLCDRGNPGMASGGMGDVLTGIIAGLAAQGLGARNAARMGVWCHAAAGDGAVTQGGERGLLAQDLLPGVRSLVNMLAGP